jgi:zinc protease
MIGQPSGLKYSDPDRIALATGTTIFGGGYFSSRLLATVRAKEGLTYAIYALLSGDTYTDGEWVIQGTFAPQLLEPGLASTRRELTRFVAAGVTADELRDFKSTIAGTYKIALATSSGMAEQIRAFVQRGLPLSYLDDYPTKVGALTLEQVNGAIKKYLDPEKVVTVLAGTLPDPAPAP